MSLTNIIYDLPRAVTPRARIIGMNIVSAISNLAVSGRFITFDDLAVGSSWQIAWDSRFFPPTSNIYTLDYTLDPDDTFVTIGGVEVAAGILVTRNYVINEYELRLIVQPLVSSGQIHLVNLERPSPYWYPYSS